MKPTLSILLLALLTGCCCSTECAPTPKEVCSPTGPVAVTPDGKVLWVQGPRVRVNHLQTGESLEVPADERWYPDRTYPSGWRREPAPPPSTDPQ